MHVSTKAKKIKIFPGDCHGFFQELTRFFSETEMVFMSAYRKDEGVTVGEWEPGRHLRNVSIAYDERGISLTILLLRTIPMVPPSNHPVVGYLPHNRKKNTRLHCCPVR